MSQTTYTLKAAEGICAWLAGGKSLVSYCQRKDTPGYRTIMTWLTQRADFRTAYILARQHQADYLAEETIDIADKARRGAADVARLRVDARKWYAAKLSPKKYSDKIEHALTGPDGGPVEFTEVRRTVVDPKSA